MAVSLFGAKASAEIQRRKSKVSRCACVDAFNEMPLLQMEGKGPLLLLLLLLLLGFL